MDERLMAAIEAGDGGAVGRLIGSEPELARARRGGLSAVMLAAYHRQPEIARALLEARGPADLFEAAALGLERRVRQLIGWDPRSVVARSPDGFTALHLAAYFGRPGVVRILLDEGVDLAPAADNASRVRPLHSAVAGGNEEVVALLLEAGADVEVRQEGGFTPLMGAAAAGSQALVGKLLEAGADKAARSDDGKTALALAREQGHDGLEDLLGD
ncbi:MAG: ankyrin repeat domain-containing protein [Gemmatimonadota bacterium]|jgi:ankyrin repeat protein